MMSDTGQRPVWKNAEAYENFAGKWSRAVGGKFLEWLALPEDAHWLEVGCGTGAFTEVILDHAAPAHVTGIDPAEAQLEYAEQNIDGAKADFRSGDAVELPFTDNEFDVAVSGLVLNFVTDQEKMVSEMKRVVRPSGSAALYVWDFDGRGPIAQHIAMAISARDAAAAENAATGQRFETTHREFLSHLFQDGGLVEVETQLIEIDVFFKDFDAYWSANTGFTSPVSQYAPNLPEGEREKFVSEVKQLLPISSDGSINFVAGANAVRGTIPS